MTRPLPAPLVRAADPPTRSLPAPPTREMREVLARSAEIALPIVGELLRRRLSPQPREPHTALDGLKLVESVHLRLFERADGTREWRLEHVRMEAPRHSRRPGRWVMLLSILAGLAFAASRLGRAMRR